MKTDALKDRLRFITNRIREHLWFRPAVISLVVVGAVLLARVADGFGAPQWVPEVSQDTLVKLLTVLSGSMLVIATFAVGSMVAAYDAASRTATPRSFSLILADDVSQNALSAFIGAFIFSIVGLVAVENSYYGRGGRFTLFLLVLIVFAVVVLTFVRWVDRIARLGRLGPTIKRVESAGEVSIKRRKHSPRMGGVEVTERPDNAEMVKVEAIGYVARLDVAFLQSLAEKSAARIEVVALPGKFVFPGESLAVVKPDKDDYSGVDPDKVRKAFVISEDRTFDEDPRFGLVALSEIASRALSPGVNDPGTAIEVISSVVRLFSIWGGDADNDAESSKPESDRVEVPELSLDDMFNDAFGSVARDGAGQIEVVIRVQKALGSLAGYGDDFAAIADRHSRVALKRAKNALSIEEDIERAIEVRAQYFG
ncbi:MAG: DUF2254 domain-containing protein [Acidobacteria bacterium]|nr:MAG: DUF2254 domain-containing protein [Acidobacteriota bacterium]REK03063.1 MAG: DUF2254 domain-containing protein [Acidobacteriota bacterium]REK13133.1 MAG: DUF2254 domain-containing protein [Acidobacteriota bacterium]REK41127.1 MAG: DUF2254 domain-containing protein [Acidobacteriota bacterium]